MFRCNLKCVRDINYEYRMETCYCRNDLSTTYCGFGIYSILNSIDLRQIEQAIVHENILETPLCVVTNDK